MRLDQFFKALAKTTRTWTLVEGSLIRAYDPTTGDYHCPISMVGANSGLSRPCSPAIAIDIGAWLGLPLSTVARLIDAADDPTGKPKTKADMRLRRSLLRHTGLLEENA